MRKLDRLNMTLKENNIEIKKDRVLNAYNKASDEQKLLLENIFGKEIFQPEDIRKRVKTFKDAVDILGKDNPAVIDYYVVSNETYTNPKDIIAFVKLRVIAEALNEGWKPTFDECECRYYPFFYTYYKKKYDELNEDEKKNCHVISNSSNSLNASTYFTFAFASNDAAHSYSVNYSRFAFKTKELAEYCGKQFIDIWADYLFA